MAHCTGAVLAGSASLGPAAPVRPPVLRLDLVGPGVEPPEHVLGPPQLLLGEHELGTQARDLQIELVVRRRRHVGAPIRSKAVTSGPATAPVAMGPPRSYNYRSMVPRNSATDASSPLPVLFRRSPTRPHAPTNRGYGRATTLYVR